MDEQTTKQLSAEIANNLLKATASTTARDLQINTLENNYKNMFDQNTKEHTSITESLATMATKLDQLIDKMDARYARSWTEKAWIWLFVTAGTVVVGLIIRFIVMLEIK